VVDKSQNGQIVCRDQQLARKATSGIKRRVHCGLGSFFFADQRDGEADFSKTGASFPVTRAAQQRRAAIRAAVAGVRSLPASPGLRQSAFPEPKIRLTLI